MKDASQRIIPADVLTPIGAYRALAVPQASCLLESVESGGRISRYSFIGLDYLASENFDADDRLYDRVREFIEAHRVEGDNAARGGALLAFSYDAARPAARRPARAASAPAMPARANAASTTTSNAYSLPGPRCRSPCARARR